MKTRCYIYHCIVYRNQNPGVYSPIYCTWTVLTSTPPLKGFVKQRKLLNKSSIQLVLEVIAEMAETVATLIRKLKYSNSCLRINWVRGVKIKE